jgi:hypothetical protein
VSPGERPGLARSAVGSVLRAVSGFGVGLAVAAVAGLPIEAPQLVQPTAEEAAELSPLTDLPQILEDLLEPWEPMG